MDEANKYPSDSWEHLALAECAALFEQKLAKGD